MKVLDPTSSRVQGCDPKAGLTKLFIVRHRSIYLLEYPSYIVLTVLSSPSRGGTFTLTLFDLPPYVQGCE